MIQALRHVCTRATSTSMAGFGRHPRQERWLPDEQLVDRFDSNRHRTLLTAAAMTSSGSPRSLSVRVTKPSEHSHAVVHLAHLTKQIKFRLAASTSCPCGTRCAWPRTTPPPTPDGRTGHVRRGPRLSHARVETFGAPMLDPDTNRELFEEQVEDHLQAFNEQSFSHHGKHYTIPPRVPYRGYELEEITLVPRPCGGRWDCWQPSSARIRAPGLHGASRHQSVIGGGAAEAERPRDGGAWQEALARHGRQTELGADLVSDSCFTSQTAKERAIREAKPFFEEWMKMFAPLGFVRGSARSRCARWPIGHWPPRHSCRRWRKPFGVALDRGTAGAHRRSGCMSWRRATLVWRTSTSAGCRTDQQVILEQLEGSRAT